jgi:hypothetical protein
VRLKQTAIALALGLASAPAMADPITFVASLGAIIGGTAAAFVYTYGAYIAFAAYSISQSVRARKKARRAAAEARAQRIASLQDRSHTLLSATPSWRVIYGRCITGGDVVAMFTSDKTATNEDGTSYTRPDGIKHLVVEIAHHECEAIHEMFVQGTPIGQVDADGWATGGAFFSTRTETRKVTVSAGSFVDVAEPVVSILNGYYYDASLSDNVSVTPTLSNGNTRITNPDGTNAITVDYTVSSGRSVIRYSKHLGTDSQTVDTYLNSVKPTEWTSAHRGRGRTYVTVTMDLDDKRFQGDPTSFFTFDVSGRKVYDPRTGTTAWSDNPALCIRDWLTNQWGYNVTDADIDDTYTNAAANACDVSITLNDGNGDYTGKTFTCNGTLTTDQSKEAVLDDLEESMAGSVVYGAKWQIMAGAWTAPVTLPGDPGSDRIGVSFTVGESMIGSIAGGLTDDDLDGQIDIVQAGAPMDELINGLRGTYIPYTVPVGTASGYQANGAHSVNAATIALDSGSGTIVAGNSVSFAGDDNLYEVTTGIAGAGSIVIQSPGLLRAVDDNAAVSVYATPKATPVDFRPPYQNSTFVSDDGVELWSDITLPFTNRPARCRNIARIMVERNRSSLVIRYPAKLRAWPLQVGDRITVNSTEYGFVDKVFRVTDWNFGLTSPVLLTLQEDAEEIYDLADAATADPTPNTALPNPRSVSALSGLAASSSSSTSLKSNAGILVPRVSVTWTRTTDRYVIEGGYIEVMWRDGTTPWVRQDEPGDATGAYIVGPKHGDRLVIKVRAVNGTDDKGPWSVVAHTVSGATAIDTPQLVDEAATELVTYVSSAGTRTFTNTAAVESVAFTTPAPNGCKVVVTAFLEASVDIAGGAGSTGYAAGYLSRLSIFDGSIDTFGAAAAYRTDRTPYTLRGEFDYTGFPNQNLFVRVRHNAPSSPAATVTYHENPRILIELIKK